MKAILLIILLLSNIKTSEGAITHLGKETALFESYDGEVIWLIGYDEIGFVPELGETYTIVYNTNGTEEEVCEHKEGEECLLTDDIFMGLVLGSDS